MQIYIKIWKNFIELDENKNKRDKSHSNYCMKTSPLKQIYLIFTKMGNFATVGKYTIHKEYYSNE